MTGRVQSDEIGGQLMPPKLLLISGLKNDPSFNSEAERVQEFTRRGGRSRATYFNQAKKLKRAA